MPILFLSFRECCNLRLPLWSFQTQAADQEAKPPRDREQLFMERRALAGAEAMAQEQRRKTRRLEEVVLLEGVFGRLSLDGGPAPSPEPRDVMTGAHPYTLRIMQGNSDPQNRGVSIEFGCNLVRPNTHTQQQQHLHAPIHTPCPPGALTSALAQGVGRRVCLCQRECTGLSLLASPTCRRDPPLKGRGHIRLEADVRITASRNTRVRDRLSDSQHLEPSDHERARRCRRSWPNPRTFSYRGIKVRSLRLPPQTLSSMVLRPISSRESRDGGAVWRK